MKHVLILGAGFSGKVLGKLFVDYGWIVIGTSRHSRSFEIMKRMGLHPILFDGERMNEHLIKALYQTTHLVVSLPPSQINSSCKRSVDPFLSVVLESQVVHLAPNLQWVGYLSTVGVYGNHHGDWVDETSTVKPIAARSKRRMLAENEWLKWSDMTHIPTTIFRLSGIYGPGRNALLTLSRGKSQIIVKEGQVFNRIHVEDVAQAVVYSAENMISGVFNITDNLPAPPQDVMIFSHKLMGISSPLTLLDFESVELTPMVRSFYKENKRVSNQKSKTVLNMNYKWPDYRTALRIMWYENLWNSN
ncbi:SDR family oxidoreductase [Candidatus Endowatersipora endosymbiont of Watersipora subatra]|uniref:SDR family oxidoreductase n=1 Tax=Candidatus Endowatersipora endosymbiont of Watersipora subatra TaxID=3077946 RepID=UPI00312C98BD